MHKDYGCRGRQRTVLNTACVKNLEVNEEEITKSERENKETKQEQRSRKDWDTTWSTGNKTTAVQGVFRTNKRKKMRREGEKM